LFDQSGNRLSQPEIRTKPDMVGIDFVPTTYAQGNTFEHNWGLAVADAAASLH